MRVGDPAAPFCWTQVEQAVRFLPDTLLGLRDKILLAVGHNTMARRSELVAVDITDIEYVGDAALVAVRPTKTNLKAEAEHRYLSPLTTSLVRRWLEASELSEGPVFVRVHRSGAARRSNGSRGGRDRVLLPYGRRLSEQMVNTIVKRAVVECAVATGTLELPQAPDEAANALDWLRSPGLPIGAWHIVQRDEYGRLGVFVG